MTNPRRGVFALKDWLQLILALAAVCSLALAGVGWLFLRFTEWKDVPERMSVLESRIAALPGSSPPAVIEFMGGGIVSEATIQRGRRIDVAYVLRRVIDCPTDIHVRFFDHQENNVAPYTYTIPATRSPVSHYFSPFSVPVVVPKELPPGVYSYFPEIQPQECGVYGPILAPMSEAFEVTE